MKRKSQQGVALVITLILLSVITFMAVTFLVVSRKEASQVNTLTQQANAKFASEAGLEEAKAQIIAQMLTTGNGLNFGLLVSTNFISGTNFDTTKGANNLPYGAFTNVTYAGLANADLPQMLNNLIILPRVPVFIVTNKGAPNSLDFRYYLDLNRNGRYDTNGLVLNLDTNGIPVTVGPPFSVQVGDPEWVGILNHPDQRHSSSNLFVARYCFIALPIGNSLDVNYIHNQSQQLPLNLAADGGYLRDQGVGSWEINLAGFLTSLNTNYWPTADYKYVTTGTASGGEAFNDAAAIVQYRYNKNYANLSRFSDMFSASASPNANFLFGNDLIDGYSVGPIMTNIFPLAPDPDSTLMTQRTWSGANNPNSFFTTQDFYGAIPSPSAQPLLSFTNRLHAPGLSRGTYDRYTYYRMLAQMSFGSAPESSATFNANTILPYPGYFPFTNRLNLNYNNISGFNATNFQPWTPVQFFTNAANRLLANAGLTNVFGNIPLSVTNIPIYPINMYTPAVHRLLQLAANIYDATTNRYTNTSEGTLFFPSVFRPTFGSNVVNGFPFIFINGYAEEQPTTPPGTFTGTFGSIPISLPEQVSSFVPTTAAAAGGGTTNIYGIPWVIGAKKGFPNFNEFSMATVSQITRKIAVINTTPGSSPPTFQTNLQYTVGVSNVMGVEAWNSYSNSYGRAIDLVGSVILKASLSNYDALSRTYTFLAAENTTNTWQMTINPALGGANNTWAGAVLNTIHNFNPSSLRVPLATNVIFVPDSAYHPTQVPHLSAGTNFDTPVNVFQPHFILNVSNYVRYIVQDHATGRILDYVTLNGMTTTNDLMSDLQGTDGGGKGGVWMTNILGNPNQGISQGLISQLQISEGVNLPGFNPATDWLSDQLQPDTRPNATQLFAAFLNNVSPGLTNAMQAPYTPTRKVVIYNTWQANDPLVHYVAGDLVQQPNPITNYPSLAVIATATITNFLPNLGQVNLRYRPWNDLGTPNGTRGDTSSVYAANRAAKDPLITRSDDWQFPTNKFPNIGWLGRVHRGTPWQTVYLKSDAVDFAQWQLWTGNTNTNFFATVTYPANTPDAFLSMPTNDWTILDLFTTALNDNASRGQLSVNQTGEAAWAAIFDGVSVLTPVASGVSSSFISPTNMVTAGTNVVQYFAAGINAARSTLPGGVFTSIGQILAAPQLTVQSPYLGSANASTLSDAVYERIPQQIMSLLRVGSPRYVIFAYGQSLKPADHSIVQSGPFFGMCTNYAITGEVASRTILRIDNPPIPGRGLPSPQAVVESFNVLPPE